MRARSVVLLTVLTLGCALLAAGPATAETTLVVDDDGFATVADCDALETAYSTIEDAVDAAAAGDTIEVCPGEYEESVEVDKTLEILGAQAGVDGRTRPGTPAAESNLVNIDASNSAFIIVAPNVVISGFRFVSYDLAFITNPGASGLSVTDSIFEDNEEAILVRSPETIIRRNRFVRNFTAIEQRESKSRITSNDFIDNLSGLVVIPSEGSDDESLLGILIRGNRFDAGGPDVPQPEFETPFGRVAVEAWSTTGLRVVDNVVTEVERGIWLRFENVGVTVEANDVSLATHAAILVGTGFTDLVAEGLRNETVTVRRNVLTDSGHGVLVEEDGLDNPMNVNENVIAGNGEVFTPAVDGFSGGGVVNQSNVDVNALRNWWGDASGPSGWSIGEGDFVSDRVRFFPWALDPEFTAFAQCSNVPTAGPDKVQGTGGSDILCGEGGQDEINGRGGDDLVLGDSGSDTLLGGGGDDAILGGQGDDLLSGNAGFDFLQGQSGTDRCYVGPDGGRTSTCEVGDVP